MDDHNQEELYRYALTTDATEPRPHCVPGDGWGVWEVKSKSTPGQPHKVNLATFPDKTGSLNGSCSCADFVYRCLPNFNKHNRRLPHFYPAEQRTRCRHIAIAEAEAMRVILWKGLKNEAKAALQPNGSS